MTCYTTDRATGHTRERGELERLREENTRLGAENEQLRRQIAGISLYAQSLMGILTQQGMPVPAPQQVSRPRFPSPSGMFLIGVSSLFTGSNSHSPAATTAAVSRTIAAATPTGVSA